MHRYLKSLALLLTGFGLLLGYPPASGAQENPVELRGAKFRYGTHHSAGRLFQIRKVQGHLN